MLRDRGSNRRSLFTKQAITIAGYCLLQKVNECKKLFSGKSQSNRYLLKAD